LKSVTVAMVNLPSAVLVCALVIVIHRPDYRISGGKIRE
jgi:hypothetical protein